MEFDEKPRALKGLVAENAVGGYSLNLENFIYTNGDGIVKKSTRHGTIPKNMEVKKFQEIKWKIYVDEPDTYLFDTSYSYQNNKEGGKMEIIIKGNSLKHSFKPTCKTIGEPLQDWIIDNYKSNRVGSVEITEKGIYEITVKLEAEKQNPIKWQWLWIDSKN